MAPDARAPMGPADHSGNGGNQGPFRCPICGEPTSPRWLPDHISAEHEEGPSYDS